MRRANVPDQQERLARVSARRPTIGDVGKRAGTSAATVSHVLRGTGKFVSDELAARVRTAAQELGYRPSPVARALRTNRTRSLGVVVPDLRDHGFALLLKGCAAAAQAHGFSLLLEDAEGSWQREVDRTRSLVDRQVEGLIVAPVGARNEALAAAAQHALHGPPVVLVGGTVPNVPAPAVLADVGKGTAAALDHLWERGHRRIAFIGGALNTTLRSECYAAYRETIERRAGSTDPSLVVTQPSDLVGGYKAMVQLRRLTSPPTATFVAAHSMVLGAMKALAHSHTRCPEEMAVVGVGDYEWAEAMTPSLTVVALPAYEMGYRAVTVLADAISSMAPSDAAGSARGGADPAVTRLPTQLIIRGSTDPEAEEGFWDAAGVAV